MEAQVCELPQRLRSLPDIAKSCKPGLAYTPENTSRDTLRKRSHLCLSSRQATLDIRSTVSPHRAENKRSQEGDDQNLAETIWDTAGKDK